MGYNTGSEMVGRGPQVDCDVAAAGEIFFTIFFLSVQKHVIAYCGWETLFSFLAVSLQHDSDLQQGIQLHFSLTGRDGAGGGGLRHLEVENLWHILIILMSNVDFLRYR
jgi:hypothetical protein